MDNGLHHASLGTLFWTFLKIGSTAFGGFIALISVVQNSVVERRQLLSQEEMLNGVSLASILPGPVAFNVVAYVGYKLQGGLGALVCTFAVTLPTFLLIVLFSYGYFTWGELPSVNKFFQGIIPAVTAIILAAVWNMGRKNLKGNSERIIAVVACLILVSVGGFGATFGVILSAGAAGYWLFGNPVPGNEIKRAETLSKRHMTKKEDGKKLHASAIVPALSVAAPFFSTDIVLAGKLFVTFAVMSVFLFGGGFVFIPLIQEVVVDGFGWVTTEEFVDGIALGQATPGPILISAAFIGYKMAGLLGAIAATLGIFIPPALIMLTCARYLDEVKSSVRLKAAMRGVRAGVIGMILAAAYLVAASAQANWISLLIFFASTVALLKYKLEVVWIIFGAGALGLLLY